MRHRRSAILFALGILAAALAPVQAQAAAPPRVVALADLGTRPVEVPISSKQVTLIHFEPGDVSMVAVGDPAIVSVTVKGPDVLLKASASSGSTNAFIWQASRYTQWTFTIRQNTRDARVIIVRDSAASSRDESNSKTAGGKKDGKTAIAAAPARQPSGALASHQPATTAEKPTDVCRSLGSSGVAGTPSAVVARNAAQDSSNTAASCSGSAPAETQSPPAASKSLMQAGVVFSVTLHVVDGQLFLYYVLENHSDATLLTDILRLRISDRNGNRLAFRINRSSQDSFVGRLEAKSVEYGLIGIDAAEKVLVLEWKLVALGSGAPQLVWIEVQVP